MIVLTTLGSLAFAQDFAGAEVLADDQTAEVEEAETTLSAELGGQVTTGNADLYVVNGGAVFGSRWDKNKFSALAGVNTGGAKIDDATDYQENVRRIFGDARYDRFLTEKDSLYFLAGAFHDIFAGYDARSHEQIGYSRLLVDTDKSEVRTEIGVDWAQEWRHFEDDTKEFAHIVAGRLLAGASHQLNEHVGVADTFELYENVINPADLRLLNTASLVSTLGSNLSLKVSHTLLFDNVPVEGFEKLDQTVGLTLVATLL